MSTSSIVSVNLLKPHVKNKEYYGDLDPAKYEELKRSMSVHGIRDSLKVLPDFTVIAGHQRLKIALELGIEKVPVKVEDLPESEAEYLLIADNEERRQTDNDSIRQAKRAEFLAGYWGVRLQKGGNRKTNRQIGEHKTANDVAEAVGVKDVSHLSRLLKLNDLIPELQALVSSGKLGTTAAYELAFLSPDTQKALHDHYGRQIAEIKHAEAKELRRKIEAEIDAQRGSQISLLQGKVKEFEEKNRELQILQEDRESELKRAIVDLQDRLEESIPEEKLVEIQRELKVKEKELAQERQNALETERKYSFQTQELKKQIKALRENPPEKVVVKEVEKILPDPKILKELEEARRELVQLKNSEYEAKKQKAKELEDRIEELEKTRWQLEREIGGKKSAITFMNYTREAIRPLEKAEEGIKELARSNLDNVFKLEVRQWIGLLKRVNDILENVLTTVNIPEATVLDITSRLERRDAR